jgi:hypothetical protein
MGNDTMRRSMIRWRRMDGVKDMAENVQGRMYEQRGTRREKRKKNRGEIKKIN